MFSQTTFLLALASSAAAHMTILNPVPFGKATLNSSPLTAADYPCKQRSGVYDITEMNQWDAGTTQVVSFMGSAVHGGGSCQFSITTDAEPTEKSQWKVIQSVIGGCPSNVTGNLVPADPNGQGAATFPVTMPKDIPDGRYTFAWTWLNKVGNREFYMNCAPVQVGSGTNKASTKSISAALSTLPDMFVSNLDDSCSTAENEDFEYPNPGKNVVTGDKATPGSKISGAGCSTVTKMGAGSGQLGSPQAGTSQPSASSAPAYGAPSASSAPAYAAPSASSAPAYAAPPASSAPAYSAVPSSGGGIFAPGAAPAPAASSTPVATPSVPASQPSSAPQQPQVPDNSSSTPSGPAGNADCTPCQTDGAVVCMGANMFGLCNHGCAVAQPLAKGMSCSAGVVIASTKRSLKFPRGHLHRRHGASHFI